MWDSANSRLAIPTRRINNLDVVFVVVVQRPELLLVLPVPGQILVLTGASTLTLLILICVFLIGHQNTE